MACHERNMAFRVRGMRQVSQMLEMKGHNHGIWVIEVGKFKAQARIFGGGGIGGEVLKKNQESFLQTPRRRVDKRG